MPRLADPLLSQTPQITFRGAPILNSGRIWKYYTTKIAFQKHDILLSTGMFVFFSGIRVRPKATANNYSTVFRSRFHSDGGGGGGAKKPKHQQRKMFDEEASFQCILLPEILL